MRAVKRVELGLSMDDVVLISAGRLDLNKNNEITIRAMAMVPEVKLLICGEGEEKSKLENYAGLLGVSDRVIFLGNRTDIKELYQCADIFILSSFREGLSRSIMEAMASGLPCIVSRIRGNVDLIDESQGGYHFSPTDADELAAKISLLKSRKCLRESFSKYNLSKISNYSLYEVVNKLKQIYKEMI